MSTPSTSIITMKPPTTTVSGPGASGPYQGAANQTAQNTQNTAALTNAGTGTKGGGRRRIKTRKMRRSARGKRRAKKTYRRRR